MVMPSFLIIGAAKAGTTALHEALAQHPQVFMSPTKEPNFFALEGNPLTYAAGSVQEAYLAHCITDINAYRNQFLVAASQKAIGEASPIYLYDRAAPDRIKQYVPDVKLIAILRDPIERAYSNFLHHIRDELETTTDFLQAVQLEGQRISEHWWWGFHYLRSGFYYEQLQRYVDHFDANQIRIYLYEDLVGDRAGTLHNIFQFIGVDSTFVPDMSIRQNVTGIPKNRFLHQFLSQKNPFKSVFKPLLPTKFRQRLTTNLKNKNLAKPPLSAEVRQQLLPMFHDDILKLQELLQRDLSKWLR